MTTEISVMYGSEKVNIIIVYLMAIITIDGSRSHSLL